MSRDPYRDETAHVVERAQRQLEHEVGACRSSAFVLTLEGLPDQAASYLARAANFEVQLRQLGWPRRCLHSHRTAHADCSTGMVPSATFVEPPLTTALQRDIQSFSKRTVCLPGRMLADDHHFHALVACHTAQALRSQKALGENPHGP